MASVIVASPTTPQGFTFSNLFPAHVTREVGVWRFVTLQDVTRGACVGFALRTTITGQKSRSRSANFQELRAETHTNAQRELLSFHHPLAKTVVVFLEEHPLPVQAGIWTVADDGILSRSKLCTVGRLSARTRLLCCC